MDSKALMAMAQAKVRVFAPETGLMPKVSYHEKVWMVTKLEMLYGLAIVGDLVRRNYNSFSTDNILNTFEMLGGGTGMPIEGLSDRTLLPRLGKIHLGIRDPQRNNAPRATDYFVLPKDHALYTDLVDTFGEQPTELRIVFPVNDEEQVASQYYRQYSQSRGLICKGDGLSCNKVVDKKTGKPVTADTAEVKWVEGVCGGTECPDYMAGKCKETLNLQFMLPEIPGLGIWQIDSGSINSIININSQFALIRQVYGTIAMVPLILSLEEKEVKTPGSGKLKTVRVMHIRSGDTLLAAAQKALMGPLERLTGRQRPLLEAGDRDNPEIVMSDDEQPDSGQAQRDIDELWDSDSMRREAGGKKQLPPAPPADANTGEITEPVEEATEDTPFPPAREKDMRPITKEEQLDLKKAMAAVKFAMGDLGLYARQREWGIANMADLQQWHLAELYEHFKTLAGK